MQENPIGNMVRQENFCSLMTLEFICRVVPVFIGEQLVQIERGLRATNAMVDPCLNPDSNKTTVRRHFFRQLGKTEHGLSIR